MRAGLDSLSTVPYSAPELLNKDSVFDNKVDSWSMGVMLHQILTSTLPFDGDDNLQIALNIIRGKVDFETDAWLSLSIEVYDFVDTLLCKSRTSRPDIKAIRRHSWLQDGSVSDKMAHLGATQMNHI